MEAENTFRSYRRAPFDAGACTRCGLCLTRCPVMGLSEEEAKAGIAALIDCLDEEAPACGPAARLLRQCTSCFACNLVCPEDCQPANLFLDVWYRQYRREGLPARARYFLPHSVPNFRTYVIERLREDERAAIAAWACLDPVEEIFYPGCNIVTAPYLTFSRLFDGVSIRGGLEYCCGEMYFRMGLHDQLEEVARKNSAYFQDLGVKRVHLLCTAGLNLFTHVLPQFGADFSGITFVPFLQRIYDQLFSGEVPIVRRFDGETVTVQDSCHAKVYSEGYADLPRKLLTLLGFSVVEATASKDTALCCGIGSGFSHDAAYSKGALIRGQRKCTRNARGAGADRIVTYCAGCLEMLSAAKHVAWNPTPVYHIFEVIQEAIGECPRRRQRRIAADFTIGTLRNQRSMGGRFFIPPIE